MPDLPLQFRKPNYNQTTLKAGNSIVYVVTLLNYHAVEKLICLPNLNIPLTEKKLSQARSVQPSTTSVLHLSRERAHRNQQCASKKQAMYLFIVLLHQLTVERTLKFLRADIIAKHFTI